MEKSKMEKLPNKKNKSKGGHSEEEKPKALELTKEQLKQKKEQQEQQKTQQQQEIQQRILQQQEMLQNPGIFRLNLLNHLTKQNDIFIELGQSLLDEMKGIRVALEKLGDTTEDPKE